MRTPIFTTSSPGEPYEMFVRTLAAARAKGCKTVTGADMFAQVRELMVNFLLEV